MRAETLYLMLCCWRWGSTEGDVTSRLAYLGGIFGHTRGATVACRGEPEHSGWDLAHIIATLADWPAPLGAEYKPGGDTDATLGWLEQFRG